jgi:hypothetical protein
MDLTLPLGKYTRLSAAENAELAKQARALYRQGLDIRAVGRRLGRSYGATHHLLVISKTKLRPRGGAVLRRDRPEE